MKAVGLLTASPKSGGAAKPCLVVAGNFPVATCSFDSPGAWKVSIYASDQRYDSHPYVAGVDVNDRG